MTARTSWARVCARLILILSALLFWNTVTASSAAAQGSFQIFLYDTAPNPPYDVTSTYVNNHVTDKHNNTIYVTLNYQDGNVYDLTSHVIGFLEPLTTFQPGTPPAAKVPMPALVLF